MPITCYGHPWGGEQESAKMTGLRLPPPSEGLRDSFPIAGWGPFTGRRLERQDSGRQRERWCWRSDAVKHRPCRTIRGFNAHRLDRDIDRQPLSTQDDIAMTSAVLALALSLSTQSPQGAYPTSQGKVLPAPQAPAKIAPAPQAPAKIAPAPQAPAKILPAPQAPAKVLPAPQAPSKIAPAPQAPSKILPAPQAPSKIAPAPQAPAKILPAPQAPAKVSPAPQAPAKYVPMAVPQAPAKAAGQY